MRHKVVLMAAAVALLAGGGLFATSSASAATPVTWDHVWYTSDAGPGGTVYIRERGDVVTLCDTAADGYAPRVEVTYHVGTPEPGYKLTASGGYGSCTTANASMGGWKDLPENATINVKIYLGPHNAYETKHSFVNDK